MIIFLKALTCSNSQGFGFHCKGSWVLDFFTAPLLHVGWAEGYSFPSAQNILSQMSKWQSEFKGYI